MLLPIEKLEVGMYTVRGEVRCVDSHLAYFAVEYPNGEVENWLPGDKIEVLGNKGMSLFGYEETKTEPVEGVDAHKHLLWAIDNKDWAQARAALSEMEKQTCA